MVVSCRKVWVQIAAATLSGNNRRQTVHIHRASVHQAAKLVAALVRVTRVTAGLAESNGFMTHVTCRLTAKYRDQLWNPRLGNRVWATLPFFYSSLGRSDVTRVTLRSHALCGFFVTRPTLTRYKFGIYYEADFI